LSPNIGLPYHSNPKKKKKKKKGKRKNKNDPTPTGFDVGKIINWREMIFLHLMYLNEQ
jgi:hypothetical protein